MQHMARARRSRVIILQLVTELHDEVHKLTSRPAFELEGRLRTRIDEAAEGTARLIHDALETDRDHDFARLIRHARAAATTARDGLQAALVKKFVSEKDLRAVRLILAQLYPALTSMLVFTANFQSERSGRSPSCSRPSEEPSRT